MISPKKRIIKAKGASPSRISRRQGGADSDVIKIIGSTRSTKALIKGGWGGRIKSRDSNWEYFVTSNKAALFDSVLPADMRKRNKNVFINVEEVEHSVIEEIIEPEVNGALDSCHILGLQNISAVVNDMLSCKCQVNQTILDFINYCSLHSHVDAAILREICNEWKNKIKG